MQNTDTRNEIKQLARTLETLAQQIQSKLDAGDNILPLANELARNSSTFVFTCGSLYTLETNTGKTVSATAVSSPKTVARSTNRSYRNNYSVRDSLGRFARNV
jgi:hypothetical protein